jgi:hypothetical protein
LPLGRAVMHTGEIDAARPLELLWIFGVPTVPLLEFAQARIERDSTGALNVSVMGGVKAELWGDAAGLTIGTLA